MKKNSGKNIEQLKAAAEAARRKLATATALAQGLKEQARAAKAQVKEARKKLKRLRKSAQAASDEESQARKAAEKAALKLRKLKKKGTTPIPAPKKRKTKAALAA
jgi:hypothetical protein